MKKQNNAMKRSEKEKKEEYENVYKKEDEKKRKYQCQHRE